MNETRRQRLLRTPWQRAVEAVSWTPPTSTEVGVVIKCGIAAALSWAVALLVTGVDMPVIAPLTAIVVVQVSVRASIVNAIQRSAAVVIGVLLAIGVGDTLGLNALTVGLIVIGSLGFAQLLLRLPRPAAQQVPVSALVVLAAISATPSTRPILRAVDTVIGAAVGVAITFVAPASRLVDARQTLGRLAANTADVLTAMGTGVATTWTAEQSAEWRRRARTTRDRLVQQATEAVGSSREASRWNIRDRGHLPEMAKFEEALPRLERTAVGVSVIARGLDDHAHLHGTSHSKMTSMGALLVALAVAVRASIAELLDEPSAVARQEALAAVRDGRSKCVVAASRRAREALEHEEGDDALPLEIEWLNYAAILVQVDRIVADLSAPLPT